MGKAIKRKSTVIGSIFFRLLHLFVTMGVVFFLSYLLGNRMLNGPLMGNDSPMHIGYAYWLNEYFPNLPHWYPLQGGGVSLVHGYPILSHLIVVVVHRISGLSILQTFRMISYLGFPITALGIYLFCWSAFRRQTLGLIAAILYLLAPVTWTWMYDWGFFAQRVAMIFMPLALIAFDKALVSRLNNRQAHERLWLTINVIFILLAGFSHILVGASIGVGMVLYTIFYSLVHQHEERRNILYYGIRTTLLVGLIVGLVAAFYLIPYYKYGKVANREGLNTPSPDQLHKLPILEFFGLRGINRLEILTRMQFPLVVTFFVGIGFLLALFNSYRKSPGSKEALTWSLVGIFATIFTLLPALPGLVLRLSPLLIHFLNFRSMILITMITFPVIASYGVCSCANIMISPKMILKSYDDRNQEVPILISSIQSTLTTLLSLILVGGCVFFMGSVTTGTSSILAYGPRPEGFEVEDIWGTGNNTTTLLSDQLSVENWPPVFLNDYDSDLFKILELGSILPPERPIRLDISPHLGRLAMDLVTYANASQINTYTYTLSLIHEMWGYQQNVFYSRDEGVSEFGTPQVLNNVAGWFGTKFSFLNPKNDPTETYSEAGWYKEYSEGEIELWHYAEAPDMASSTSKPTIMIIGKPETDAYMTVYRLANDGVLPFEEVLIMEGKPRIDQYTVQDFESVDALFLYGYDYKNNTKAWDLLARYVQGGGSVFIDTGWEFWIPEWEFEQAPEVLPVECLTWTDYGMTSDYWLESNVIGGDVDVSQFKPLIWEGQPWTLSGATMDEVRDWGEVVLGAAGRPLIVAGEYGEGRVVWSGMNLVSHATYLGNNEEELQLVHNLFSWLTEEKKGSDFTPPIVERDYPDLVKFTVDTQPNDITWLYWREAYYPNWHAYLHDDAGEREIPIYRGGPGFMLMPIETSSEEVSVTLRWESSFIESASIVVSMLGVLFLIGIAIDGLFLGGQGLTWFKIAFTMRLPRPFLDEKTHQEAHKKSLRVRDVLPDDQQDASIGEDNKLAPNTFEDQLSDEHEALLKSWLDDKSDKEDPWVSKMLDPDQWK